MSDRHKVQILNTRWRLKPKILKSLEILSKKRTRVASKILHTFFITSDCGRERAWKFFQRHFLRMWKLVRSRPRVSASGFLSHNMRNKLFFEYCEIFKMAFSKILDFLRRLKIRSKAPARYYILLSNEQESQNCDWVLFSVNRFLI